MTSGIIHIGSSTEKDRAVFIKMAPVFKNWFLTLMTKIRFLRYWLFHFVLWSRVLSLDQRHQKAYRFNAEFPKQIMYPTNKLFAERKKEVYYIKNTDISGSNNA